VALLALAVRQPGDRQQVRALEQPDAVVEAQTSSGVELIGDLGEAG
jgi:hypothetical protein